MARVVRPGGGSSLGVRVVARLYDLLPLALGVGLLAAGLLYSPAPREFPGGAVLEAPTFEWMEPEAEPGATAPKLLSI